MFLLDLPSRFVSGLIRHFTPPPPQIAAPATSNGIPPAYFKPICHPRMRVVATEVDGYFLKHWPFPNDKARKKFLDAGFSRVTCLYYPEALDDRIHFGCRLLTLLFLIDGMVIDGRYIYVYS
jgi:hypothetical protein